jgi:hypothetical protein
VPDPSAFLPELVTGGGLTGVLFWLLWALTTGRLWTGGQVDRVLASKDGRIDDLTSQRDDWRGTARTEAARGDILARNQERTLELQAHTGALLESLVAARGG